jgi:hypothetical protein
LRWAGFLPLNFMRSTKLSATTKLSAEHETPPIANVLLYVQRTRLGDVAVFENRQPVTAAEFISYKSSLLILPLYGLVLRRLELKPNSEQKVENIFVAPPYCQTASYVYILINLLSVKEQNQKEQRAE